MRYIISFSLILLVSISAYSIEKEYQDYLLEYIELKDREIEAETDVDIEKLENYLANPLNLNKATFSQLLELPYISEHIARDIILFRMKNKRFSSIKELKEVVPDDVFIKIYPFIEIKEKEEVEVNMWMRIRYGVWPYPFDSRVFTLSNKYYSPEYFYINSRFNYASKIKTGAILKKDRNSKVLNWKNIKDYFLIKKYIRLNNILGFDTLILGDYNLSFFQGLFIQTQPFLARRVPRKSRGIIEEDGTNYNYGFFGISAAKSLGKFKLTGFYSDKPLIIEDLNEDGTAATSCLDFYDYTNTSLDITRSGSKQRYECFGSLRERLAGMAAETRISKSLNLGLGYYYEKFEPLIDPSYYTDGNRYYLISKNVFRGDKINLLSVNFEYKFKNTKFYLDSGKLWYRTFDRKYTKKNEYENTSPVWYWDSSKSYQIVGITDYKNIRFWVNYHFLDFDYYAFHSSSWMLGEINELMARNERGYLAGIKHKTKRVISQASFGYAQPVAYLPAFDKKSLSYIQVKTKDVFKFIWDSSLKLFKGLSFNFRNTYKAKTKKGNQAEPGITQENDLIGLAYTGFKTRYEAVFDKSDKVRIKWRVETLKNSYKELSYTAKAMVAFAEVRYRPSLIFFIDTRITFWDSPKGTSAGAMEYAWPNALIPYGYYSIYGSAEKKFRWYVIPNIKLSDNSKFWMKYEFWPEIQGIPKNVFKVQYEYTW